MLGCGVSLLWSSLHKTNYKCASLSRGIIRGFVRILVCRGGSLSRFAICTFMATASCTSSGDPPLRTLGWKTPFCLKSKVSLRRSSISKYLLIFLDLSCFSSGIFCACILIQTLHTVPIFSVRSDPVTSRPSSSNAMLDSAVHFSLV